MDERIIKRLVEMRACKPAVDWAREFDRVQQAWDACKRGDQMLWLIDKMTDRKDDAQLRKLTLVKGWCAEHALDLMQDERSRAAVQTAIAFGKGRATAEQLAAAADAASDATEDVIEAYKADRMFDDFDDNTAYPNVAAAFAAHAAADINAGAASSAATRTGSAATRTGSGLEGYADIVRAVYPECPKFWQEA